VSGEHSGNSGLPPWARSIDRAGAGAALAQFGTAAMAAPAAPVVESIGPIWLLLAALLGAVIAIAAFVIAARARTTADNNANRQALANAADWYWRTNGELLIRQLHPGRRKLDWLDRRNLIGRPPWQILPGLEAPAPVARAITARAPFYDELIACPHNGATRIVALSGTPIFGRDGDFAGYAGTARDVTEAAQALTQSFAVPSEQLEQLRNAHEERTHQLELAVKELDSFSHSVSHDLRAPLRVVDGFATIVLEDYGATGKPLDELGREHLKRIISAGQRMNSMIDTLLTLSRMTSRDIEREHVNLSQLARELAEELRAQDPARSIGFSIADGLTAEGDRTLLRLVLQNLLGNAAKYSSKNPQAHVAFGTAVQNGVPVFFVNDNGAGFDMRFADKLFGLFQRFHSQSEFPGTGVGLATVQRIVRKHGGRIWAESEPGKGATFFFTLWER
jgi:PAS domain S-box-containing protein